MSIESAKTKKSNRFLTVIGLLLFILFYISVLQHFGNEKFNSMPMPLSQMRTSIDGNLSMSTNRKTQKPTPSSKLNTHMSNNKSTLSFNSNNTLAVVMYYHEIWGGEPDANMEECQYKNCIMTPDKKNIENQAAVLYFLPYSLCKLRRPPIERNPEQVWIFVWHESSVNLCHQPIYSSEHWTNMVNWTMSFEYNNDIFLPFGKIVKSDPNNPYRRTFHKKTHMAAWVVSNCQTQSKRGPYVKELQKHGVKTDIFGRCAGTRVNAKAIRETITEKYKFYLAFENSFCKDYITEKFYSYFELDVIIVVRGGGNYSNLLPSNAYINAADFKSAKELATYMLQVANNEILFEQYMVNKNKFSSSPVPWSEAFCKICHKLNHLDQNRKTYFNLDAWIHKNKCHNPPDI